MESIRKKAGYLEGLFEAMKKDEKSPETMLQQGVISLLSELTERVEAMDDLLGELNDYVESIDDDLSQMEGMHDMDDDFDMMAYPDEDILRVINNDDEPEPAQVLIPVRCAECFNVFLIDGEPGKEKYVCPTCGKTVKTIRVDKKNTPIGKKAEE